MFHATLGEYELPRSYTVKDWRQFMRHVFADWKKARISFLIESTLEKSEYVPAYEYRFVKPEMYMKGV